MTTPEPEQVWIDKNEGLAYHVKKVEQNSGLTIIHYRRGRNLFGQCPIEKFLDRFEYVA